jgi:hypothetical protein
MNDPDGRYAAALEAEQVPFGQPDKRVIDRRDRSAKEVIHSRVVPEIADALIAEALRCKQAGSALIADLIAEALAARAAAGRAELVTVNLADLHRAIDRAARRAA